MTGVAVFLSEGEAKRLTERIRITATSVRDNLFKLRNLVDEAKRSNVAQILGYASWTAYLADTLAAEPMRLGREDRQELVEYLSGEGLSTRAIAPIVGVHHDTVASDIKAKATVGNPTVAPDPIVVNESTGEVIEPTAVEHTLTEKTKTVTGLNGKTYTVKPTVEEAAEADPAVQDARYLQRFHAALARVDDFLLFDAERVGRIDDQAGLRSLDEFAEQVVKFRDAARKASRHLYVIGENE